MWRYFLNWMGPVSTKFIKEHGDLWSGGRIDADCDNEDDPNYSHFGVELSVPYMHSDDWDIFAEWIINLETSSLWTIKMIVSEFESCNKKKIRWLS